MCATHIGFDLSRVTIELSFNRVQYRVKKIASFFFLLFWIHFFFFLLFFLEGDLERDLDRFFRDEFLLEGEPLRDLERLRLCLLPGERLRDRDLARPRDELRLRDRDLDRLEFEGEGVRDS